MILEVDDNGRLERIAVIQGNSDKEVDGRKFFGGYRLKTEYLEEVWFDMALWDIALVSDGDYLKTYRLTRKAS